MRTKRVAAGPGQTERRGRDDELTDTCLQSHNVLLFVSVCAIILRVLPAVSVPSLSMSACFKATAERTTLNKNPKHSHTNTRFLQVRLRLLQTNMSLSLFNAYLYR